MLFNRGLMKARIFEAPFVCKWVIQGDIMRSLKTASLNSHLTLLYSNVSLMSPALSAFSGNTFLDDFIKLGEQ